jgi:hypothetical protein
MAQETITAQDILRQSLDRNRYFYGKLMTVRDFTQEQLYFNAKRWLINRLLFGSGVICGLEVEVVTGSDPATIVIKPGLALDPLGREVTVIDVPGGNKVDLTKLIPVPSAPAVEANGFICLSHRQCPKDPVPSLKSSPCDEACESNRWSETFDVSWDEETSTTVEPSLCQNWLNRTTVSADNANLKVERTTPLWARANEVFEVVVRVTAKQDVTNVRISEQPTNASLIEPTPALSAGSQFPTPPVNLKTGEFFVYIYQVKSPAAVGSLDLKVSTAGLPNPISTIDVLSEADAKARETQFEIEGNCGEPVSACVRIAKLKAQFKNSKLDSVSIEDFAEPRFRYSLEHVAEMLDCLRASLFAEAGSSRPGHAFITFNDLETSDLKPIGSTAAHGNAFTVTHGDHVHALLRAASSGLEFIGAETNQLRINGDVGGETIKFLNTVKGQKPIEAEDLVTKDYVDAHIAGLDWQESVLDKDLTAPPATPNEGDRYLLFNDPTETWKGQKAIKGRKNDIATFNGKVWEFTTPDEGTCTFVEDENVAYMFVDGKWIPFLAAPTVAAGDGLVANGAILSVGKGKGIVVNPDDVAIAYETNAPQPIGLAASPGSSDTTARGNHVHALPLTKDGGLVFDDKGLRVEGRVIGEKINFVNPVAGRDPLLKEHLATKKYVDDNVAGIEAGDGLVRKDKVISVGQGAGIKVNPDDVAVAFEGAPPRPIGPAAIIGSLKTVSSGDHVHALPLSEASGLVIDDKGLRIDGLVGGKTNFVNPVVGPDPGLAEHFATKRYVDNKVVPQAPVVAGKGLVSADHTISVGQGDGILLGEDSVAVRFSKAVPRADTALGDPGNAQLGIESAVARADHSHPLPKVTPGATSGVVLFTPPNPQKRFTAPSASINPELGEGLISVQLAFVDPKAGDTYYCDPSNFSFMAPVEGISNLQLAAKVKLGAPTTFQILIDATPSEGRPLPANFQVRWFAYLPRFAGGGGQPEPPVGPPTR